MSKFSQKTLILILVIAVLVIAGVALAYLQLKPQSNQNQNTNQSTNTNQGEEIDTSDLPSETLAQEGWKMYRNEEYGFEFRYPSTLSLEESDHYIDVLFNDSFNINIDILNSGLDPRTIKSPIGIVTPESLEEINVGGRLSYRFVDGDAGYGGNSYRIPLDHNRTLLIWFVTKGGYYTNDEREIISTFKFIDQN